jgi:hypothetical protein
MKRCRQWIRGSEDFLFAKLSTVHCTYITINISREAMSFTGGCTRELRRGAVQMWNTTHIANKILMA